MWFIKKKKPKEEAPPEEADDAPAEQQEQQQGSGGDSSQKIEMIQAELTKINGTLDSLKETRKMTSERFSTMNEQIGEIRGMVTDMQRSVGMIEVKATKAADLVESVHPDKLMIQVQKEDGKIEGLRGMIEAKEEMIKNIMDQLKKLRDQMVVFRGLEQVLKLDEEVKGELMSVKKIAATVERHADRVENVFVEAQKSFEAFNTFADKLETMRADIKDLSTKLEKVEVAAQAAVKKIDFDKKLEVIEKHDKKAKNLIDEVEEYQKKMDQQFKEMESKLKTEFDLKFKKAEVFSHLFEELLMQNPFFAEGLKIDGSLKKAVDDAIKQPANAAESGASEAKPEKEKK